MKTVTEGYKDKANQDFPHTSSDADVGNGVENSHMNHSSEQQAKRDDLSRALEDLVVDAKVWLELSNDSNAQEIVTHLEAAYVLLGKSIEASSDEKLDPNKCRHRSGVHRTKIFENRVKTCIGTEFHGGCLRLSLPNRTKFFA